MSSSSQALAALNALFEPRAPLPELEPEPAFEPPHQLDDTIAGEASASFEFVSYRWYSGVDANGVRRIFRFQRGLALQAWHELLCRQRLQSVQGPYRTQVQATAA